ncbi:MAG: hypothetical protein ACOX7R_05425 [Acetivibrionales bacterium]
MVTIGSDAHCAEHVARGFNQVKAVLKKVGFEYVILPWNRQKLEL